VRVFHCLISLTRFVIKLRLQRGRALKAEKGGFANGSPPFGFRAEGGELVQFLRSRRPSRWRGSSTAQVPAFERSGTRLLMKAIVRNAGGLGTRPPWLVSWITSSQPTRRGLGFGKAEGGSLRPGTRDCHRPAVPSTDTKLTR
jgi:hypothetical protein